jgi:sulfopropanediol 3-dehydrogenase
MAEIERLLQILPTADHARKAWETYGEVIVAESYEEMVGSPTRSPASMCR